MAISRYWQKWGKTSADKVMGKTFALDGEFHKGKLYCDECCTGDRCEGDCGRVFRDNCSYCLGEGVFNLNEKSSQAH